VYYRGGLDGLDGGVRSHMRTRLGLITGVLQGIFAKTALFSREAPDCVHHFKGLEANSLYKRTGLFSRFQAYFAENRRALAQNRQFGPSKKELA
jgi:hypothetical protein